MDSAAHVTLSRQTGLAREMQIVANNIANAATTGYRSEGLIFSEYVRATGQGASLSVGQGNLGRTSFAQGALTRTEGPLDLAIEGEGFFLVETAAGPRLTRAGAFAASAAGDLVTPDGHPVLDAGGAPLFLPPGLTPALAADGTLSAEGRPLGQIALVRPLDPLGLEREDGVLFAASGGTEPAPEARLLQGFLEDANVNPIHQLARMIEVQRAYELGQSFLQSEDERQRAALSALMT